MKKITLKEQELLENEYILAINDVLHSVISANFAKTKMNATTKKKIKESVKVLDAKNEELNELYLKKAYMLLQSWLKNTDIDAFLFEFNYSEDDILLLEYDLFRKTGQNDESGEDLFEAGVINQVFEERLNARTEDEDKVLIKIFNTSTFDEVIIAKNQSYESFKENFDLQQSVSFELLINLDDFR